MAWLAVHGLLAQFIGIALLLATVVAGSWAWCRPTATPLGLGHWLQPRSRAVLPRAGDAVVRRDGTRP